VDKLSTYLFQNEDTLQKLSVDETEAHNGEMILTGDNTSTRKETCPSALFSTTNLTWTDLRSNKGLHCKTPGNNRLSRGTALRI